VAEHALESILLFLPVCTCAAATALDNNIFTAGLPQFFNSDFLHSSLKVTDSPAVCLSFSILILPRADHY